MGVSLTQNIMNKLKVVVTGEPRSGTSLVMGILNKLEIPVYGEKYPKIFENRKELNPVGFWEHRPTVNRGMPVVPDEANGTAVKIMSTGMLPLLPDRQHFGTLPDSYEKIIWCIRNPKAVSVSQRQIQNTGQTVEEGKWTRSALAASPARILFGSGPFAEWASKQDEQLKDKILFVDYDELVENPELIIDNIISHLDINNRRKEEAESIVNKDLTRSTLDDWPDVIKNIGELADDLYVGLKNKNWALVQSIIPNIQMEREYRRLESIKWTDNEFGTYRPLCGELWRLLQTNKELLNSLKRSSKFHNYKESPFYKELKETYTIERPLDVGGDLISNFCECVHADHSGVKYTQEQFYILFRNKLRRLL